LRDTVVCLKRTTETRKHGGHIRRRSDEGECGMHQAEMRVVDCGLLLQFCLVTPGVCVIVYWTMWEEKCSARDAVAHLFRATSGDNRGRIQDVSNQQPRRAPCRDLIVPHSRCAQVPLLPQWWDIQIRIRSDVTSPFDSLTGRAHARDKANTDQRRGATMLKPRSISTILCFFAAIALFLAGVIGAVGGPGARRLAVRSRVPGPARHVACHRPEIKYSAMVRRPGRRLFLILRARGWR